MSSMTFRQITNSAFPSQTKLRSCLRVNQAGKGEGGGGLTEILLTSGKGAFAISDDSIMSLVERFRVFELSRHLFVSLKMSNVGLEFPWN